MQTKIKPTLNWVDVPDTINPEHYAQVRGISVGKAREIFNSKNFPRIDGTGSKQLADKKAVMLYDMGINPKIQSKESISFLILSELKKLNSQLNINKIKEMKTNEET